MRVLIATPDFPLWDGGVATVAYEVANGLHKLGHEVNVLAPEQNEDDRKFDSTLPYQVFRIKNIKDHYLKMYYHIHKMNQLVKIHTYDLIMAQSWYPSGIAANCIAKKNKINMTVTVHGNEILNPRFYKLFWQHKMYKVFDNAKLIFCVSNFTANKLLSRLANAKEIEKKIKVIFNGVDCSFFKASPPDNELFEKYNLKGAKIILTLARLVERKGHDTVIRALPLIKDKIPQVKYIICGKGPYERKLKELTEEVGLVSDVIFTGFIPDKLRSTYYNLCDLYIMPSREMPEKGDMEGFGITYLEANACEKPVIGSNAGGVSDAVKDGESGFIVDSTDYSKIAEACIKLLSDPALAKKIGQQGRERVIKEFNWDNICQQIENAIK
jgi:phosphatidylinositol alpha-1,6-mannosyltransferase